MSEELVMPRLSDTMEEGTIGRWVVAEGDSFKEGDVLAEIETDKATMDFQAYEDGTVLRILVGDGESAPLGSPIAIVGDAGESVPDAPAKPAPKKQPEPEPEPEASVPAEAPAPQAAPPATGSGRATGLGWTRTGRRMAEEAGVDLQASAGQGSGPEGRIVKVAVERILKGSGPAPPRAAAPAATPVAPAPAAAAPPPPQ